MRVISKKKLVEAVAKHSELATSLDVWYRAARKADWKHMSDVKRIFSSADPVGSCTVFNIKGNAYRLIVWISYGSRKIFIKHVLTHAEYTKEDWKRDCFSS